MRKVRPAFAQHLIGGFFSNCIYGAGHCGRPNNEVNCAFVNIRVRSPIVIPFLVYFLVSDFVV